MGNICVVGLTLLDTHNIFSYFLFLLFKNFPVLFSLFIDCKQTGNFFRLLAYPLRVSSAMEYLKVTLSEAVYYLSSSVETETEMFMNRFVGQQNLNRGCYVSYFATFIFVTISSSFHNFFMKRVYHTKTFNFRMWKIILW